MDGRPFGARAVIGSLQWGDERYVKVYVRDTLDWLALSYEAEALYVLLMRKFDRAGIIRLGRHDAAKGLAAILGHAHRAEVISAPLAELLTAGALELDDGRLTCRDFIESQGATTSVAQRKRDQREREAAAVLAEAEAAAAPAGDAVSVSRDVTAGHAPSRAVTPNQPNQPSQPADPTERGSDAAASAPLVLVAGESPRGRPKKQQRHKKKQKPEPTPEQAACRRAIASAFAEEFARRSSGGRFRWSEQERVGIIRLVGLDEAGGVNPAEGLRLLSIFIERMATDTFYAKNFRPSFIASDVVINALRVELKPDGGGAVRRGWQPLTGTKDRFQDADDGDPLGIKHPEEAHG